MVGTCENTWKSSRQVIHILKQRPVSNWNRFHHSAVVYQGSMYVFGGHNGNTDIIEYRFGLYFGHLGIAHLFQGLTPGQS